MMSFVCLSHLDHYSSSRYRALILYCSFTTNVPIFVVAPSLASPAFPITSLPRNFQDNVLISASLYPLSVPLLNPIIRKYLDSFACPAYFQKSYGNKRLPQVGSKCSGAVLTLTFLSASFLHNAFAFSSSLFSCLA